MEGKGYDISEVIPLKKIVLLFVALLCLFMAGCGTEAQVIVEEQPSAAPVPAPTAVPESEEPAPKYGQLLEDVQTIISNAGAEALTHETNLSNAVTQADMNVHSHELYMTWDDAINEIWALFDDTLDRDLFYDIQAEQIAWITEKELELQKIREEYQGGSITALACNTKAAEMTKERIYELLTYIEKS